MPRHTLRAALVAAVVLVLSGCVRYSSSYTIQSDDTVDGTIFVSLKEGYQNAGDPYYGTGAGDVAANFSNATIYENMTAGWYGYYVDFYDEPLATFAWTPDEPWKLQITKSGGQYIAYGFNGAYTADDVSQIQSQDGWMVMSVTFPGPLTEQAGAVDSGTTEEGYGWAYWDLLAIESGGSGQAYAKGGGALTPITIDPGVFVDLFPDPATLPAEPAPAVTITLPPPPPPAEDPDGASEETPDPTETTVAVAEPDDNDAKSTIPVWVWAVGAALVAALVGLIGYTVAGRKSKAAAPVDSPAPTMDTTKK